MIRCTHKGCGQEYDPANNGPESCTYHPGAPIFHEGLKSWSCCSDVNKPVLDFDEFMAIEVSLILAILRAPSQRRLTPYPCLIGMYHRPAHRRGTAGPTTQGCASGQPQDDLVLFRGR